MERRFVTLDVFTDRRLAGNPLAVVLDADDLSGETMQAIAREFNLSETVFVLPPEGAQHRARTRIFTPTHELPFAGHPTIGTAILLAQMDWADAETGAGIIVLEQGVGPVRVGVTLSREGARAEFDAPRVAEEAGQPLPRERIAPAIGLLPNDIGFAHHRPTVFSGGAKFVFVPVRNREALARARVSRALWPDGFEGDANSAFLYTTGEGDIRFRARMFAPMLGIDEDPATGSAVAVFAGVVARFEGLGDGSHLVRILQGEEMGRPSHINLEVEIRAGSLVAARVGGQAVVVSRGTIDI